MGGEGAQEVFEGERGSECASFAGFGVDHGTAEAIVVKATFED